MTGSPTAGRPGLMDPRSEGELVYVLPALADVLRSAAQTPQPFVVVYGLRQLVAEESCLATGHSETLHSRHLASADGLCRAVDVAALVNGEASFVPGHESTVFGTIAAQIKAAAAKLEVPIQWGGEPIGAWTPGKVSTFRDWGHFQLPWAEFP